MQPELEEKYNKLRNILLSIERLVIGFSGGVDSTLLLKVAIDVLGRDNVLAVTSSSETHPLSSLEEAKRLAKEIGADHKIIESMELSDERFSRNDKERCYYCKKILFSDLREIARDNGYSVMADGSNADDSLYDYRPGLKAIKELGVRSPLLEAGLAKKEIRELSKELGLPTWDKAAFACLGSRFPYGEAITSEKLEMVDKGEAFLKKYGFSQLRLRQHDQYTARIEVLSEDMDKLMANREEIVGSLKKIGYNYITLDIEGYRTGSMNELL